MAAARAAFGLRDLDARVAELVRDSEVGPPLRRCGARKHACCRSRRADAIIECEVMTLAGRGASSASFGGAAAAVEAQVQAGR